MRKILTFLSLILSVLTFAQEGSVTGTVTDAQGEILPGVNVLIEGTTTGTQTDFDGLYSLNVATGQSIKFTYVGFVPQSVVYAGQPTLNITLKTDENNLDEVVVVGYGTQKRSDITTSVSSVKSEDLTAIPAPSVNEALEGRAAGVQVRSGGAPGEDSNVRIRGLNTFGDGTPLYVVDGIFVESLNQINPASIASVDVLKDAAASAIYGSRGSNGVVIITTKKGKEGKAKFTFSTYAGFQKLSEDRKLDLLNGTELASFLSQQDQDRTPFSPTSEGLQTSARFLDPDFVAANTRWMDEIYSTAPISNYDLGVSGGSEIAKYNIQAGIYNQEGIQIDTKFKRYTFNTNSEIKLGDKFKIGQTLNIGQSKTVQPEQYQGQSLLQWAISSPQYLPVRLGNDGPFVSADRNLDATLGSSINPVYLEQIQNNTDVKRTILGSFYGEYKLFEGLTNRTQLGVDLFYLERDDLDGKIDSRDFIGDEQKSEKFLTKERNSRQSTAFTNILSYNKTFGDHNVQASGIFERVDVKEKELKVVDISQVSDDIDQLVNAQRTSTVNTSIEPQKLISYIGRGTYSFRNKYIVSGSVRKDFSSVFPDNPDGVFPAGSLAWVVSNEGFLSNNDVINNLKLRAGYGVTGNNKIDAFKSRRVLSLIAPVVINNEIVPGALARGQDNRELKWERSIKTNYGLDIGFLNNQVMFSVDYFNNDSEDLLARESPARSLGTNAQEVNVGDVTSKGLEFTLGYNDYKGDFQWNFWGSFSTVDVIVNRVKRGGGSIPKVTSNGFGDGSQNQVNVLQVGEPIYAIRGFQTEGIFKTKEDLLFSAIQQQSFRELDASGNLLDNGQGQVIPLNRIEQADGSYTFERTDGTQIPLENVGVGVNSTDFGDLKYKDQNGDGVIDAQDIVTIGDPNPDFTYSFNIKAQYKGFDAAVFVTGVQGGDVINVTSVPLKAYNGIRNFDSGVLNSYSATNTETNLPRYSLNDPNNNDRPSDYFIEDGSYTRIKNVTVGYSISENMRKSFFGGSLSKLRLYFSAQNLFTFTKYTGLDPEIRPTYDSTGLIGIGIDQGFTPTARTIIGGLEIEF